MIKRFGEPNLFDQETELLGYIDFIERKLLDVEKGYKSVIDNIKEVIFQTDAEGRWTFLNPVWTEITGFGLDDSMGKIFLDYVHPDDRALNAERFTPLIERKKDYCRHEIRYLTKSGGFRWIEVFARLTLDEDQNIVGTSGTLMDITDRKNMEFELEQHRAHLEKMVAERTRELQMEMDEHKKTTGKLEWMVTHDQLTELPNRYWLENLMEKRIRTKSRGALIVAGLDNFKIVNSLLGHTAGDLVIRQYVDLVKGQIKNTARLVKLGADELGLVVDDASPAVAQVIAERLRKVMSNSAIKLDDYGVEFNLTISVGVVMIEDYQDAQTLLSSVNAALVKAKEAGKNQIAFIDAHEERSKYLQVTQTVAEIKKALREGRFVLHYQPIFDHRNEIVHYEALIRMRGVEECLVYPGRFIPVAEKFGLAPQIDQWTLSAVLGKLALRKDVSIFLNLSGMSLMQKSFLAFIEHSIKQSGINPCRIGFEVTETAAVGDLGQCELWIRKLKQLGCKFALDDFGVGFSSFSYLHKLPIDYVKIDGSFVNNLVKDPTQGVIVKTMNDAIHTLGKKSIAEYVESREIMDILEDLSVDYGQGFYLARPEPLEDDPVTLIPEWSYGLEGIEQDAGKAKG